MSVVGVDLGNMYTVAAKAARGGIDVMLNQASKRTNASAVSFSDNRRFMGDDAAALKRSNFRNTFLSMKRLLGRRFSDADVQEELERLPFSAVAMENGLVGVETQYNDETIVVSIEQLVAMVLQHVKGIATAANEGKPVAASVVSVPPYYTDMQRRSLLNAARIADLNVLRLMPESTAVALAYGMANAAKGLFDPYQPSHVMFVDVGESATWCSIVDFLAGGLTVRATTFDRGLGGREFDRAVALHLAEDFQSRTGMDPRENPKAMLKLLDAAEKAKKTLSPQGVNEVPIHVEYVMNETDYNSTLTRDMFDQLTEHLVARLDAPITSALQEAGIAATDLGCVEIVGGGSRVLSIKRRLADLLQLDTSATNFGLRTTLNADETVARGCAFQAAKLSSFFKVKEYTVSDVMPYAIRLLFEDPPEEGDGDGAAAAEGASDAAPQQKSTRLFERNDPMPKSRRVTFKRTNQSRITITAVYEDEQNQGLLPEGMDPTLATFHVDVPDRSGDGAPKRVRVLIGQNDDGVLNIESAQLMEPIEDEQQPAGADGAKEGENAAEDGGDGAKDAGAADAGDGTASPAAGEGKDGGAADEGDSAKTGTQPAGSEETRPRKKYRKVELDLSTVRVGMSQTELMAAQETEANMGQQDRLIRETEEARNELESYVYSMRDNLIGRLERFVSPADREAFSGMLASMEDWLYTEESDHANKRTFQEKLADLRRMGDPMEAREVEANSRQAEVDNLLRTVEEFTKFANSHDDLYAHIPDEDKATVRSKAQEAERWVYDQLEMQSKRNDFEDPVLTLAQLRERRNALFNACNPIRTRPKPAPKPEPAPEPAPAAAAAAEGAAPAAEDGAAGGENGAQPEGGEQGASAATDTESQPMETENPVLAAQQDASNAAGAADEKTDNVGTE